MRALIWLQGTYPKELLAFLANDKVNLEAKVGEPLVWDEMQGRVSSMIYAEVSAASLDSVDAQYRWMAMHAGKLIMAFQPIFEQLRSTKSVPGENPQTSVL